jgi:hypothetical protein
MPKFKGIILIYDKLLSIILIYETVTIVLTLFYNLGIDTRVIYQQNIQRPPFPVKKSKGLKKEICRNEYGNKSTDDRKNRKYRG